MGVSRLFDLLFGARRLTADRGVRAALDGTRARGRWSVLDGASQFARIRSGGRLGRYVLLDRLAAGGMAEVWRAELVGGTFRKQVVIKVMLPNIASTPDFVRRFVDEAALAARLDHPNIAQMFDFGEVDGAPFIVMEYVAGKTLRQILQRLQQSSQVVPVWYATRVLIDLCDALQFAHDLTDGKGEPLNLVHRDLSPENVMVSFHGVVKLLDFGVAKTRYSPLTHVGVVVGKLRYIAPERLKGVEADRRSDVYALGVTLYELLTGVCPFKAADLGLVAQIHEHDVPDPRVFAPSIPDELADITLRAMAKEPDQRFEDAQVLQEALSSFAARRPTHPGATLAKYTCALFADSLEVPNSIRRTLAPLPTRPPRTSDLLTAFTEPLTDLELNDLHISIVEESLSGALEASLERELEALPYEHPPLPKDPPGAQSTLVLSASAEALAPPASEAVQRFERGMELVAARHYQQALEEWERAVALAPENRTYQTNLKRLREKLGAA